MYRTVGNMTKRTAKTGKEYYFISLQEGDNGETRRAINAYLNDNKTNGERWTLKEN